MRIIACIAFIAFITDGPTAAHHPPHRRLGRVKQ
jgi:hypothetical protein